MSNHYHLLIETPEGNLSRIMRHANGVYTQHFNRTHRRVGHVFQGRFKSILVEKEHYIEQLCRYIILNPVRARMVDHPGRYPWSSYKATVGRSRAPDWLAVDWILSFFNEDRAQAQAEYKRFVLAGIGEKSPLAQLKGQAVLGGAGFVKQAIQRLEQSKILAEVPRVERLAHRPSLEALFEDVSIGSKKERNGIIRSAYEQYGYQQKDIAEHLGLHYTTVSNILRAKR